MKNIFLILLSIACIGCSTIDGANEPSVESNASSEMVKSRSLSEQYSKSDSVTVSYTDIEALLLGNRFDSPIKPKSRGSQTNIEITPIYVGDELAAYAANYSDGGFVLLSASKTIEPVLAHSPKGSFNADFENPALSSWLESVINLKNHREALPFDSVFDVVNQWEVLLCQRPEVNSQSNGIQVYSDDPERDMQYQMCLDKYYEAINEAGQKGFSQFYFGGEMFSTDESFCEEVWEFAKYNVCPAFEDEWQSLCFLVVVDDIVSETLPDVLPTLWGQEAGFNRFFPIDDNGINENAGCVSVALGQLMYYYKYPENYNWDVMSLEYSDWYNSQLLWDIAQRAETKNGSTNVDLIEPVIKSFGYTSSKVSYPLTYLRTYGNPLLYTGYDKNIDTRHTWLVTGYQYRNHTQSYFLYYVASPYSNVSIHEVSRQTFTNDSSFWMKWGGYGEDDGYYLIPSVPDKFNFSVESILSVIP